MHSSGVGQPGQVAGSLGLKQWSQFIPPGWKPKAYPLKEYEQYLTIWSKMTTLEEKKIGPAMASRLEGAAFKVAAELRVVRNGTTYSGAEALALETQEQLVDLNTGEEVQARSEAGCRHLMVRLRELYRLDDQDEAWVTLDKFFSFSQGTLDFQQYMVEFERHFLESQTKAGLALNEVAKCWLFWSKSNLSDRSLADLRLKVDGDLTRWQEMARLWLKAQKNEDAASDQARGYKSYKADSYWEDFDQGWEHDEYDDHDYPYDAEQYWESYTYEEDYDGVEYEE